MRPVWIQASWLIDGAERNSNALLRFGFLGASTLSDAVQRPPVSSIQPRKWPSSKLPEYRELSTHCAALLMGLILITTIVILRLCAFDQADLVDTVSFNPL